MVVKDRSGSFISLAKEENERTVNERKGSIFER